MAKGLFLYPVLLSIFITDPQKIQKVFIKYEIQLIHQT